MPVLLIAFRQDFMAIAVEASKALPSLWSLSFWLFLFLHGARWDPHQLLTS